MELLEVVLIRFLGARFSRCNLCCSSCNNILKQRKFITYCVASDDGK